MNLTFSILLRFTVVLAITGTATSAKEAPFAPVAREVRQRTRQEVRWEQDLAARVESRARTQALLQKPLTLATAVQVALLGNRGLQASFEEIGLSFADLRAARLLPNPEIELQVKFPDRPPTAPLYEWGVAQAFLSLVMLPLRTRVATENLHAAQLRAADEVIKLVAEVKVAYYEVVADEQLLRCWQTTEAAQGSALELRQRLHEAGNVTDLALLQEQAQSSQIRLERMLVEASQRAHRERLNRLLGGDTAWKLGATKLPALPPSDPSVKALEAVAGTQRLDLGAARAELASVTRALGLEKTFRFVGVLDFGLAGEHESDGATLTGPSVRLELPIFHQGQARLARGEAQLRLAAAKFDALAVEVRSAVRELRDRLGSTRDLVRLYQEEILPTRSAITEQTLQQFNAMLTGPFDAFQARRQALEAERGAIEAARGYWTTRAELERAVGGDLTVTKSVKPVTARQP